MFKHISSPPLSSSPLSSLRRPLILVGVFVVQALLFQALLANPLSAQSSDTTQSDTTQSDTSTSNPTKSSKTFDDWVVNCALVKPEGGEEKQVCSAMQTLSQNETGKRVLAINVVHQDDGLAMVIVTPFGLDLSKGITLKANDKVLIEQGFRTCMPSGCLVRIPLTDDLKTSISNAEKLAVTLYDLNDKAIDLTVSPKGFSDAVANMNEQ